jgi:hypothetical protein
MQCVLNKIAEVPIYGGLAFFMRKKGIVRKMMISIDGSIIVRYKAKATFNAKRNSNSG